MSKMTLREICNLIGVTRRAVQGYEKAGLVECSDKNKYGYLLYDELAVEKIRNIDVSCTNRSMQILTKNQNLKVLMIYSMMNNNKNFCKNYFTFEHKYSIMI